MYTLSSSGDILKDDILTDAFLYRRLYIPQSSCVHFILWIIVTPVAAVNTVDP